jgi:hypothetical protein
MKPTSDMSVCNGNVAAWTVGWFTEGFDTPDLREAKALLEALA